MGWNGKSWATEAKNGNGPENWASGVDLGRLLDLLELDLITTDEGLQEAMQEQRSASAAIVGSTAGESSPEEGMLLKDKTREIYEPMGLNIQQLPMEGASGIGLSPPFTHANFHVNAASVWSISSFPTFLECHQCIKTMATTLNRTTSTP
ncbi:hypothetical protein MRB53_021005 [Persea americana]|uniref:Uncharacterized protein n=1 Tax=Persea americana TaxID=3435 RepID=A0ACC2L350_PERAE|nr:hypothetical protein MRB53_021005 [Persea americana]